MREAQRQGGGGQGGAAAEIFLDFDIMALPRGL